MKLKAFFITFKGLSLKKMKQVFLEDEGPTLKDQSSATVYLISTLNKILCFVDSRKLGRNNLC